MKKTLKLLLLALSALITLLGLCLLVASIHLKWWNSATAEPLPELSGDQKVDDMRYLLRLTRQVSQADAVWLAAGMENPLDQPDVWIERARQTPSNQAFADLILQYLVHLGQGGHAFLAYDANFDLITSLTSAIPRDAFGRMPQWAELVGSLPWNAHSKLDLVYQDGQYVLNQDARLERNALPAGARVERVDGLPTDDFVMAQQYRAHLRYDPLQKKFFLYPLLSVDPGPDHPGWEVTFRLPDGSEQTLLVPKYPGYVAYRPDESGSANIRCLALNKEVLYIKILSFAGAYFDEDSATLHGCFESGSFQKVIFDVRGNNGGEVWSYMDNVMAPLARQPLAYQTTAAVKDTYFQWFGWRSWLFQAVNQNDLTDPVAHVTHVEAVSLSPYSDAGWHVVRITHEVQPASDPFPFNGQAYVLADNNTLSAGDSFAAAMQQTGLAKVVGSNTVGWGQAYQAKRLYGLPHSGILFYMDSELTFNPDGSLNNFVGVIPDVFLSPSTYPTPYPLVFTKSVILADEWVKWVLEKAK